MKTERRKHQRVKSTEKEITQKFLRVAHYDRVVKIIETMGQKMRSGN